MDNFKIRELISNHPSDDNVVLNDLINSLIKLQVPIGKLEVHNYKDSIVDALKILSEHDKLIFMFKKRLKDEVRAEVMKFHNDKPKIKRNMHPHSLMNLKSTKK